MLIDTHTHLNFSAYKDDLEEVVDRIAKEDIKVINVGSQFSTSKRAIEIAEKYPNNCYAAVGLHPIHLFSTEVDESEISFISREEDFKNDAYEELAKNSKVVAIGEMGIDYFHVPEDVPKNEFENKQRWTFLKGIQLAKKLSLPLIMHCRGSNDNIAKAYDDMLAVLKEANYNNGVVHCFTADWDIAKKFLDNGFMISFTGIITYPKTNKLAEVVKKIPLDRMMVETDAPYLAPQMVRGKRNEPMYVRYVADKVAEIKKISYDEIAEATTNNANQFFKLK